MANSTEEGYQQLYFIQNPILFLCIVTFSLAGLLIQLFIVVVNVIDRMKGRAMTGADKIITALGISRIFLHGSYLVIIFTMLYLSLFPPIITALSTLTMKTSSLAEIWLSTLLSIFFYFKISTHQNIFFLRLKDILSRRVVQLIIASVLVAVLHSVMFFIVKISKISIQNDTLYSRQKEILTSVYTVWTLLPFLMTFVASLLLMILLGIHLSRMKIRGNVTSSTEPYKRTMIFTLVSFLACAIYMVDDLFPEIKNVIFVSLWIDGTKNMLPVLHSVILIYVATKLRNHFLGIVHRGTPHCLCHGDACKAHSVESVEETHL